MYLHLQVDDPNNPLATSSEKMPDGFDEVKEKTFCPPRTQRGEGQASAKLRQHLGIGTSRRGRTLTVQAIMLGLFLWFFSLPTLGKIAEYTNDKTTEFVYKKKLQRSDGKFYYRVSMHAWNA